MPDKIDITLPQGTIRGAARDGHRAWQGVPFAKPPAGPLRWRRPLPADSWRGVRLATRPAPAAPQPHAAGQPEPSEDCLYLDVCAPAGRPPQGGWPVLLFFHGGGDQAGSAQQLGLGEAFASAGIVVVKPQYRLGALGFLNLGDVSGEADAGACGLLDQLAALRWTRRAIGAFGGNPERITIYGQSAGAKAVGDLLGSPVARGLFAQAISSSGGAEDVAEPAATAAVTRLFLQAMGTADPGVLRSAPVSDILAAQQSIMPDVKGLWTWRPTVHPEAAPGLPIDAISRGSAAGVRLLIGSNGNEAALFAATAGLGTCIAPAYRNLTAILGDRRTEGLLGAYRSERGVDDSLALLAGMGDERYTVGTIREADAQTAFGPVYRYRLDAAPAGMPPQLDGGHATDLFMAWQLPAPGGAPATQARQRLGQAVHDAWVSFVKTGRPAAPGLPDWPGYALPGRQTMVLGDDSHVEPDPRRSERVCWDGARWAYGTWFPLPPAVPAV